MRHHHLALALVLGMFLSCLSSTTAHASYTWSIAPSPSFSASPGGTLAVGGTIGWTFSWDYAIYHVRATAYDSSGHSDSVWASCDVGYQSTSFNATITLTGLTQTQQDGAFVDFTAYDSSYNEWSFTSIVGTIT